MYDISPNREYMEEWVKQILKDERQKRGTPLKVKRLGRIIISINLPLYGLRDRFNKRQKIYSNLDTFNLCITLREKKEK